MLGECFDPKGELLISEHCLPHWSQAGAMVFITFRIHDSIPHEVLELWDREKQEWLHKRGWDTAGAHWSVIAKTLPEIIGRTSRRRSIAAARFSWHGVSDQSGDPRKREVLAAGVLRPPRPQSGAV
jgi:hypothetical protein